MQVAMKTRQQQVFVPSVPSEFGLGVQDELETVSEYVTGEIAGAPVNNSSFPFEITSSKIGKEFRA